ncbi:MAG: 2Fe-2S iron-sulfur cluster-binding protein [bacterium]
MPTIIIDNKPYEAKTGETILEVAIREGIWIPTLCYHPSLRGYAACRLCLVEIDRGSWRQIVTSCNYPIRKDIKAWVNSERALKARKGVMELLLARSPDSQELKTLAERMGIYSTSYPKVTESQRNCILCGLCTRVCAEVIGQSAISLSGRGVERVVSTPFQLASDQCIACGACASICPVGTIQIRMHDEEIEISPFKSKVPMPRCRECGKHLASSKVGEKVMELLSDNYPDETLKSLKEIIMLCPDCRRKRSAEALPKSYSDLLCC